MTQRPSKSRASSLITSRKMVATEHLNPNGTLFGGYLMCWMDEVAFMCARRFSGQATCVTASVDSLTFRNPHHLGENVFLSASVCAVGKTSMQIEVLISKEDPFTGECALTNSAYLTFVCLDKNFRPCIVPDLQLETLEDTWKNNEVKLRTKVRKRLDLYLKKQIEKQRYDVNIETQLKDKTIKPFFVERVLRRVGLSTNQLHQMKAYRKIHQTVSSYI